VKARDCRYERARSLQEALDLLHRYGTDARLIAGGQSLVPALNLRMAAPDMLIDIGALDELRGIRLVDSEGMKRLRIGAMVTHAEIARSRDVALHAPLLALAVKHVAHAAIRNRGTFGGSIAHADPAAEFPACVLALGARMHIASRAATRIVAAEDFFLGLHETAIKPGEILVAVDMAPIETGFRPGFAELARRSGDYALVGLALQGKPTPGRTLFEAVSPVFFSVGDRPILARAAANILMDSSGADGERIRLAQAALATDLAPPSDTQASSATRLHLARVLLGRVVAEVLGTAIGDAADA
jgi:aerobic carbon-monoxide dehydrogenase medium subunit